MAEKDKLSKEVEEQIQSLASDVYIQIEEKLTQLISAVSPKDTVKEIDREQEIAYLKLQDTYQISKNEFAEQSRSLSEKINQLEQNTNKLKEQLGDAIDKKESIESKFQVELTKEKEKLFSEQQHLKSELSGQVISLEQTIENLELTLSTQKDQLNQAQTQAEEHNQQSQSQIASNEKTLLSKEQEIAVLNDRLLASTAQEQSLVEQKSIIKALSQEVSQLNAELQQAKIAEEKQQKIVSEQQVQLVDFNEKIKQKVKAEQDYKKEIKQLISEQLQIKNMQLTEQKSTDLQHKQQQQAQVELQQQVNLLEIKNQELKSSLITEQSDVELYQKEVSSLKSQLTLAQEGQENILNRFNTNRDKQEKDNNQVRETIKYLRDENNNMITQNNIQKEESSERIFELENKLTEYRLKFEYAQKQLTQNS